MIVYTKSWQDLFAEVIETGLCTLCGACSGFCPYLTYYRGRIAVLDNCTRTNEAQCYQYCPRTYIDLDTLSRAIFLSPYSAEPLGHAKAVVMARSADTKVRAGAQYGGVVTTILSFALQKRLVDAVLLVRTLWDKTPQPFVARTTDDVMQCMGSNYMACPLLHGYNQFSKEHISGDCRLAIVATPCQVLSVAKMKSRPPQNKLNIANVKLVIGLFCTWALIPDRFSSFLRKAVNLADVIKFDVPPPPANRFDIYTKSGRISLSLEQIREFTMPACAYCTDMTSEFADISVGAAEGIEGWNTVVIRSEAGDELWQRLTTEKKVEVGELPSSNLEHLQAAAMLKKKRAITELTRKSGDQGNLLYLGLSPELLGKWVA